MPHTLEGIKGDFSVGTLKDNPVNTKRKREDRSMLVELVALCWNVMDGKLSYQMTKNVND